MKRLLRWAGIGLALATGGFFVVYAEHAIHGRDLTVLLRPDALAALGALIVLYGLLVPITAIAWTSLLRGLGQPVSYTSAVAVLAITQFGKYLPGNVAQHIGRVAMARREMRMTPVVLSMVYETLLVITACVHVAMLTLLWAPVDVIEKLPIGAHRGLLAVTVSLGAVIVLAFIPRLALYISNRRLRALQPDEATVTSAEQFHPGWKRAIGSYGMYVANFLLVGLGLWILARALSHEGSVDANPLFCAGAFAASWVLGFLAPGAPAGLGVREAMLAILLGAYFAPTSVVILVVGLRIATTLGDLLNFCTGLAIDMLVNKRRPWQSAH